MSQAQLNLVKSKHHIRLKERLRIVTHQIKHAGKVEQSELMLRYQKPESCVGDRLVEIYSV